jgi:Ni/Fe-hydrogenase subunit HybB-like protein
MLDDLLAGLFGEAIFGRLPASRRAQLVARLFFGLLGAGLGITGAIYIVRTARTQNLAMLASMAAVFGFLACFCLFNVALGRTWRWPGLLFVVSFVMLLLSRLLLGP